MLENFLDRHTNHWYWYNYTNGYYTVQFRTTHDRSVFIKKFNDEYPDNTVNIQFIDNWVACIYNTDQNDCYSKYVRANRSI